MPNYEINSVWSRHLAQEIAVQMVKRFSLAEKEVRKAAFWPHTNLATLMEKNNNLAKIWQCYKQVKKKKT